MANITKIIFKDVKENKEYGYGMYGEFKVIIMKENGYINASKLCELGHKQLKSWTRNDSSQELIETAKRMIYEKTGEEIEVTIKTLNVHINLRGTYVHPDLIVHIASWVSSEFAMKVSGIVNNYIASKYEGKIMQKDNAIIELNLIFAQIRKQNDKLSQQNEEIKEKYDELLQQNEEIKKDAKKRHDELLQQNEEIKKDAKKRHDELLQQNEDIKEKAQERHDEMIEKQNKLLKRISTLKQQNNELLNSVTNLESQNVQIQDTLAKTLKDRVPKTISKTKDEYLAVIKNKPNGNTYYIIRRQRNSIKSTIYKYMSENKGSQLIYISWNPNAVNNYIRLKEKKYSNKVITNYNDLTLINSTSEQDLKRILYEVNNEKYNTNAQRELSEYIDEFIQNMVKPKYVVNDSDEENEEENEEEENEEEEDEE